MADKNTCLIQGINLLLFQSKSYGNKKEIPLVHDIYQILEFYNTQNKPIADLVNLLKESTFYLPKEFPLSKSIHEISKCPDVVILGKTIEELVARYVPKEARHYFNLAPYETSGIPGSISELAAAYYGFAKHKERIHLFVFNSYPSDKELEEILSNPDFKEICECRWAALESAESLLSDKVREHTSKNGKIITYELNSYEKCAREVSKLIIECVIKQISRLTNPAAGNL